MIIVLVSGGSGSGKTTLVQMILTAINNIKIKTPNNGNSLKIVQKLNMDDYYKTRPLDQEPKKYRQTTNFDTPQMLKIALLEQHLIELSQNKSIIKPLFDFVSNLQIASELIDPSEIIVLEGLFVRHINLPKDIPTYTIHVQTSSYTELVHRRAKRDIINRDLSKTATLDKEKNHVGPGFFKYTAKRVSGADLYVENNSWSDLETAANTITQALLMRLKAPAPDCSNAVLPSVPLQECIAKSHLSTLNIVNRKGMTSPQSYFNKFFSGVMGETRGAFEYPNQMAADDAHESSDRSVTAGRT